jgi:two-component system sensor histidine kinase DesK
LYESARLVRVADELQATRIALAQAAVSRERLRVSRDLHDLMGHSLSAISLKGDLAIRMLRRDPVAAQAEIDSLAKVTREALQAVQTLTSHVGGRVTLERELDDARALLTAAGVAVRVRGSAPEITGAAEEVLAWVVREGVTNVLRHAAAASTATIIIERRDGRTRLEILNDGAGQPAAGRGHGLPGLAERLAAVSGTLGHERLDEDRFQLSAEVPAASVEETSWNASGYSSPKTST